MKGSTYSIARPEGDILSFNMQTYAKLSSVKSYTYWTVVQDHTSMRVLLNVNGVNT